MSESTEIDYARELVGSAVHAPDHYLDVITLACAASYKIDDLESAPRILTLGLKGSGKSTVLKVAARLANCAGPVTGVLGMTAPSYVAEYRMEPHWTPCIDEMHHLFGEAGQSGKQSKFYTYLNQGYTRDTAYAQHQENRVPMRIPIFGIAFLAGLGLACPPDMRERAIVMKMERAPENVRVADFSSPETRSAFNYGGKMLQSWAQRQPKTDIDTVRGLHPKLNHRIMDVWGPIFAMAQFCGELWLQRILLAFERIEMDGGQPVYAPEDQLLMDYLTFSRTHDVSDGIPSGQFAEYANSREHGAYMHMKPGQFKQFAVSILGPTTPFYDHDESKMVRGWSDMIHKMNYDRAEDRKAELESYGKPEEDGPEKWEDF
jgi:hypothetical protein